MFVRYNIALLVKRTENFTQIRLFLESGKTLRKVSNGTALFLVCLLLCIFDRRGCSDLFLLFISGF